MLFAQLRRQHMFNLKRLIPSALALALLGLAGPTANAQAQKLTLRVADSLPTTHIFSIGFQNWMKRVTELTGGQVSFQHFPGEQLGKRKDMFDMARNGTVDIAYVLPVDHQAQLARATVVELPGFATLSSCGTPVLRGILGEYMNEEYVSRGVRPLLALYVGGYEIFSNRDVRLPSDLKGMKVRSAGGSQDVTLKALGAVPISLASPEVYESMGRKTIDGVLFPWTGVPPWKLNEVAKNSTYGAALGATVLIYLINESVYQRLPQNVKAAMAKATDDVSPALIAEQDKTLTDLVVKLKGSGMKIIDLTRDDLAVWRKSLVDVERSWLDSSAKSGVKDPQSIIQKRDALAVAANCK